MPSKFTLRASAFNHLRMSADPEPTPPKPHAVDTDAIENLERAIDAGIQSDNTAKHVPHYTHRHEEGETRCRACGVDLAMPAALKPCPAVG